MMADDGYFRDCAARLERGVLTLENELIRRVYVWNGGHLIGQRIMDKAGGRVWDLAGAAPDLELPGQAGEPVSGSLLISPWRATSVKPAHLWVDVTFRLGQLEVRRRFRIYPGCPAIACDLYLRGRWLYPDGGAQGRALKTRLWDSNAQRNAPTMERICIPERHLRLDGVQFHAVTDRRNTLVETRTILPYRSEACLQGNVLLVRDVLGGRGLFLLKEAPCSEEQIAWPGCDFVCKLGEIRVIGIGVEPDALCPERWTRCYGVVTGVASVDEYSLLSALRAYQERIRVHQRRRDEMVLLNTWGDRGQDTRIGESFALAELECAARLGISHFQLDDGWQAGRTSNSAYAGGSLEGIWDRDCYWSPHPARFPRGLEPVARRSKELGIELCLWFNPSKDDSYAHWREDADALIGLYRKHGIRTFKIDGVEVPDGEADRNLRAMLERVVEATGGEAVFNMDVTAGRRWGYHYGNEYGNIFLENRYTDWSNYYPHWTLRNLWMLARYVPPQNLQIEFLNKWRNADRYPPSDPLAPQHVPFDYCFAIAMMGQPLAWFEATGLPEEAFALSSLVRVYRQHQERIHAGRILPIGEEPSGTGWTGFQSLDREEGYLVVYRELNDRPRARLALWDLAERAIQCRALAGRGPDLGGAVGENGEFEFELSAPFTFGFYRYSIV